MNKKLKKTLKWGGIIGGSVAVGYYGHKYQNEIKSGFKKTSSWVKGKFSKKEVAPEQQSGNQGDKPTSYQKNNGWKGHNRPQPQNNV